MDLCVRGNVRASAVRGFPILKQLAEVATLHFVCVQREAETYMEEIESVGQAYEDAQARMQACMTAGAICTVVPASVPVCLLGRVFIAQHALYSGSIPPYHPFVSFHNQRLAAGSKHAAADVLGAA